MLPGPTSSDALTRFVFEHAGVRGAHVYLDDTVRAVLACHPYPPALQRVLAELLAAAALLAATLKFDGSLIMQLQGDGPVRLLVVECTHALELRATAQWDAQRMALLDADATLAELAGGPERGRLVMTLDPRGTAAMYQGIVTLESGSVAGLIEHYLVTSEQLASRMLLATGDGAAAGFIVQRMPGAAALDPRAWTRVRDALAAVAPSALLRQVTGTEQIATAFPHDDVRVFRGSAVRFGCACSRERVKNALCVAGAAEIESILAERGDVLVTCEFCNRRYTFTPPEARTLFAPGSGRSAH